MTIRNIPDDLYDRLKESAATHRRSINSEVIVCLETALRGSSSSAAERLARIDALRGRTSLPPLDETRLRASKRLGRP